MVYLRTKRRKKTRKEGINEHKRLKNENITKLDDESIYLREDL
jgi:hypothetical protein